MSDNLSAAIQERKSTQMTIKLLLSQDSIKKRFEEILGKKAQGFISSVMNVSMNNKLLKDADPQSIMSAAVVAATLDLPIDPNLGFSYIVPYGGKAQFQMGYKGYIQLALRTAQYERINAIPLYESQFKSWNPLTEELGVDFTAKSDGEVVGFAVYMRLINGYEKTSYYTKDELISHGKRYSKSFNNGPWKTHPDEMCLKTAIRKTLSKWGILSIEMQVAMKADQGVVNNPDNLDDVDYPDAKSLDVDYEILEETKGKIEDSLKAEVENVFDNIKKESGGN